MRVLISSIWWRKLLWFILRSLTDRYCVKIVKFYSFSPIFQTQGEVTSGPMKYVRLGHYLAFEQKIQK